VPEYAVLAEGLVKRYGDTVAVAGVDLDVPRGTVCALLGPNGAGKTTTVRMLTTLTRPDGGRAEVAGVDVVRDPGRVRRVLGLTAQDATVDPLLTGRENLVLIGQLHHLGRRVARARADELLAQFSLADAGRRVVKGYSGGMRRRLDLAATLVARPEVLFLDEPITGLDPRARNELWEVLDTLVHEGATLLLTTQYLEEADRLADDIAVIDHGRVIARGDARRLKAKVGGTQLHVTVSDPGRRGEAAEILARVAGAPPSPVDEGGLQVAVERGAPVVAAVAAALDDAGIEVEDLGLRQPTLDDVFLTLTGAPAPAPAPEEVAT